MNKYENVNEIFTLGDKVSPDYFTGKAYLKILVPQNETGNFSVGNVVFEPGSRTNWHTHPAGQILLVTDGNCFYQEKGTKARYLSKGDVVVIPSGVVHWHGAAKDIGLTHIVITSITKQGAVVWLQPVTDEENLSCQDKI